MKTAKSPRRRRAFDWSTAIIAILACTAAGTVYVRDGREHFLHVLVGDVSLFGEMLPKVLAGCLIALNYAVAFLTSRSQRVEHVVEGVPKVLAREGVIFHDVLRKELVSLDDFHEALRMNNVADPDDVALALLETNGSISVVPAEAGGAERASKYIGRLPRRSLRRRRRRPGSPQAE